jgi:hypothetical protein
MNEDLLAILGQGAVDEEVTAETPPSPPCTIQRLLEVFKGIRSALKIFQLDDPNFQCSLVTPAIKNAYVCHRETFYENIEVPSVQTSLDFYF